ncbi:MAG TPA: hypothetical protein VGO92_13310 [Acidimicrobiales bacterium]|jgi:hypothetical protein|nr:hypothetical protein [Acidimicrobiales bacterium]
MKKLLTRLSLAVSLVGVVALAGLPSATASVVGGDIAVIVGQGTISPGLTTVSAAQTVSFNSIIGVGGGAAADTSTNQVGSAIGTVSCAFGGTGVGSVITGSGSATGTCTATGVGSGSITCTLSYVQVGGVVVVDGINSCTATASGPLGSAAISSPTTATAGAFLFVPTTANPTTSYLLAGGAAGVGVNP